MRTVPASAKPLIRPPGTFSLGEKENFPVAAGGIALTPSQARWPVWAAIATMQGDTPGNAA